MCPPLWHPNSFLAAPMCVSPPMAPCCPPPCHPTATLVPTLLSHSRPPGCTPTVTLVPPLMSSPCPTSDPSSLHPHAHPCRTPTPSPQPPMSPQCPPRILLVQLLQEALGGQEERVREHDVIQQRLWGRRGAGVGTPPRTAPHRHPRSPHRRRSGQPRGGDANSRGDARNHRAPRQGPPAPSAASRTRSQPHGAAGSREKRGAGGSGAGRAGPEPRHPGTTAGPGESPAMGKLGHGSGQWGN